MASPLKVEFQFDFGSPNAYLAELALPAIERRTGFGAPSLAQVKAAITTARERLGAPR